MGISLWQLNPAHAKPVLASATGTESTAGAPQSMQGALLLFAQPDQVAFLADIALLFADNAPEASSINQWQSVSGNSAGYADYTLAWQLGDQFSLTERVLSTPPFVQAEAASYKRQLWQCLAPLLNA